MKQKALLWLLILFTLFHFVHDMAKFLRENTFIDIGHYMFYTTLVAQGGNPLNPADVDRLRATTTYRFSIAPAHYPPFFYFYMRPLTALSFDTAKRLWLALMTVLLFVAPVFIVANKGTRWREPETWIPWVLLLWAQPVYEDLGIGQSNILLFFVIALACRCLTRDKSFAAGVLFAFAAMTKLHYGLFGLYYLWKRDWPVMRGIAVGGVVFGLIGLAGSSLEQNIDLIKFISHPLPDLMQLPTNISIAGALTRTLANESLVQVLKFVAVAAVLAPLFWVGRRKLRTSPLADVSMVLVLIPLLSPLVEDFHLIALFITFYVLDKGGSIWRSRSRTALWILAYLIIASRFSFANFHALPFAAQTLLQSSKILGVVILYWLTLTDREPGSDSEPVDGRRSDLRSGGAPAVLRNSERNRGLQFPRTLATKALSSRTF